MVTWAAALTILLLLGACDAPEQQEGAAAPATRAPAVVKASVALRKDPATERKQPAQAVTLNANGLTTAGKTAAFGAGRAAVDRLVAAALGQSVERSELAECGAGPMAFSKIGALTLHYQDDKLIGWFAREGSPLVTSDGMAPGIAMAQLKRDRKFERLDTTLDGEFAYAAPDGSTVYGFAEGEGAAARVASLHAGTQCFFR